MKYLTKTVQALAVLLLLNMFSACTELKSVAQHDTENVLGQTLVALPSPNCININAAKWFVNNEKTPDAHTTICHINIKVNGLIGRIKNRGGHRGTHCLPGAAASSYPDKLTAKNSVKALISDNTQTINTWFTGAAIMATMPPLSGGFSATTGEVVFQYIGKPDKNRKACPGNNSFVCKKSQEATVVLKKQDAQTCFVLTSYPT